MRDIEKVVIDTINANLEGVEAYSDLPHTLPSKYITVELVSWGIKNFVTSSSCAVQCYAESRANASDLAMQVCEILPKTLEIGYVSRCEIDKIYNFPDAEGKRARYQIVVDFTTTG